MFMKVYYVKIIHEEAKNLFLQACFKPDLSDININHVPGSGYCAVKLVIRSLLGGNVSF
jgi:hypothetical protein